MNLVLFRHVPTWLTFLTALILCGWSGSLWAASPWASSGVVEPAWQSPSMAHNAAANRICQALLSSDSAGAHSMTDAGLGWNTGSFLDAAGDIPLEIAAGMVESTAESEPRWHADDWVSAQSSALPAAPIEVARAARAANVTRLRRTGGRLPPICRAGAWSSGDKGCRIEGSSDEPTSLTVLQSKQQSARVEVCEPVIVGPQYRLQDALSTAVVLCVGYGRDIERPPTQA